MPHFLLRRVSVWAATGVLWLAACAAAGNYATLEEGCLQDGWQKVSLEINNRQRDLLWHPASGDWTNGAIILLHGGGGSYTNWCKGPETVKSMVDFASLATSQGFSVFALEAASGLFYDAADNPCGKRFDFATQEVAKNSDLLFIEKVVREVIPGLRPERAARDVFIAGISNGAFMAVRAASQFDDRVSAFAVVSGGDPYGATIDCRRGLTLFKDSPGVMRDNETGKRMGEADACTAKKYRHEREWPGSGQTGKPWFRQFHHAGDSAVDLSCMEKARALLQLHGYPGEEPLVIPNSSEENIWKHFWNKFYNQPILDFFKQHKRTGGANG